MSVRRWRPLRLLGVAWLLLLGPARAWCQSGPLVNYPKAKWVDAPFNDGDSFVVAFNGSNEVIRLYFVDCPETSAADETGQRRVLEQKRYFAIEEGPEVVNLGKVAAARTRELLKGNSFTLHTALAHAPGRSGKPRIYGMVTLADGRDLARVLIDEGLARNSGTKRATPAGKSADEYAAFLADRELVAALGRKGCWALTDAGRLAHMREEQREEEVKLRLETLGVAGIVSEDNPLDVNRASMEELQLLRGIGPAMAEKIVKGRLYKTVEDLGRVSGIGPESLLKWRPYLVAGPAKAREK